jgi:hypothetical protein
MWWHDLNPRSMLATWQRINNQEFITYILKLNLNCWIFLMIIVKNDCNHGDSNHNGICNWGHGYDL